MSALLAELENDLDEKILHMKGWPQDGRGLSRRLRRSANFLRRVGIDIGFKRNKAERVVVISEIPEKGDAKGDVNASGDANPDVKNEFASPRRACNHGKGDANDANDGDVTQNSLLTAYFPFEGESKEEKKELNRKGSQKNVTSGFASSECNYNNQPRKVNLAVCE